MAHGREPKGNDLVRSRIQTHKMCKRNMRLTREAARCSLTSVPKVRGQEGDSMAQRGPDGKFLSADELEAAQTEQSHREREESNMSSTDTEALADTAVAEIEFVDELPKIHRQVDGGVWVDRLAPLRERPGSWAKVYGPTKNPHALVNNLRSGSAAGIDPDEFGFSGRMLPAPDDVDEDKVEDGKTGYVFAKFLTDEERAERDAEREAEADESTEDELV